MKHVLVNHRINRGMLPAYLIIASVALLVTMGMLEGATFTVTRTTPDDNNPGSLRWAMNSANANTGIQDTVAFNIGGAGPQFIFPTAQLPVLTDPAGVVIDGFTQPGAFAGSNPPSTAVLMIGVNGMNAGAAHGFWIVSPYNIIQGLVVINFQQDGIRIQASEISTYANFIYCNFVGVDQSGTIAQSNGWNQSAYWAGIDITCVPGLPYLVYDNYITCNLVSANYAEGIGISSCPPADAFANHVLYNYVGTDITGTLDLGNAHDGIFIGEGSHHNLVADNLASGNGFEGICIIGNPETMPPASTDSNYIAHNTIGLDVNLQPLGNTMDGISIGQYGNLYNGGYAQCNVVDTNIIARNGRNGVTVWEHQSSQLNADYNYITRNSIYDNAFLGIDLGDDLVTQNDAGDYDMGPNQELNYPVINAAYYYSPTQIVIDGTIDIDTDPTAARVEVFKANPDTFQVGEGEIFLGAATPDPAGYWNTTVVGLSLGDEVTATTIDGFCNTSEFSATVPVVLGVEENKYAMPANCLLYQNVPNPFSVSTAIHYAIPQTTHARLALYDASGALVRVLVDSMHNPSYYTVQWDAKNRHGDSVPSGIYFYVLETSDHRFVRKLIIAR